MVLTGTPPVISIMLLLIVYTSYKHGFRPSLLPIVALLGLAFYTSTTGPDLLRRITVVSTGIAVAGALTYSRKLNYKIKTLAAVVEGSHDAIITKDLDENVLSWNHGAEELFGFSAEEITGKSIYVIIPDKYKQEERHIFEQLKQGETVLPFETVRRAKNGKLLEVSVSASSVKDVNGKLIGASKISRDLTRQKEAERLFKAQYMGTPIPIFSWKFKDGDFYLNDFNNASLIITKGGIEGWRGKKASEAYVNNPEVIQALREAFNTQSTIHREGYFTFITTGERKYLDTRFIFVWPDIVMIHTEDITERKEIEMRIRESEERYMLAQEAGEIASWEWNPMTKKTTWSRNLPDIFGIPDDAFSYDTFVQILHPEDKERVLEALNAVSIRKTDYDEEFRIAHPKTGERWILAKGRLFLDENGNPRKLVGCNMDITERKRILIALRAAKETAETANKSKDEFLGVLSHELKTPLSAILGYTALLSSGKLSNKPEQLKLAISTIERSARIQVELIEDLLDISRIVAGRITIKQLIVGIPGIVKQAVDAIQPMALEKEIVVDCPECTDKMFITGDPSRLQQVFGNILNNAVKFTPNKGKVMVHIERMGLSVKISVKDTGIGFSKEFVPNLFQKFSQASTGIRRQGKGLGLGLSIAKTLVDLHGGTIKGESAGEGKGATFTVTLPLSSPPLEEPALKVHTGELLDNVLSGLRLLVIDDDVDTLEMLKLALERYGATVVIAESAEQGIQAGERNNLDGIICDVGLPVKSGYDFIRQVRELGVKLPAIALTAFSGEEYEKMALESGFDAFLNKPIEPKALISKIAEVVKP